MTPSLNPSLRQILATGLVLATVLMLTGCPLPHPALRGPGECGRDRLTRWSEFATPGNPGQEINGEDRILVIETPINDPNSVTISLEAQAPVSWWKQMQIRDSTCHFIGNTLTIENGQPRIVTTTITRAQAHKSTLFISKAKFLGIHTGMYDVPVDLRLKLGKNLQFVWQKD